MRLCYRLRAWAGGGGYPLSAQREVRTGEGLRQRKSYRGSPPPHIVQIAVCHNETVSQCLTDKKTTQNTHYARLCGRRPGSVADTAGGYNRTRMGGAPTTTPCIKYQCGWGCEKIPGGEESINSW